MPRSLEELKKGTYLGDGCYASFDGYQIWLDTTDGIFVTNSIALEPQVFIALIEFEKLLRGAK